MVSLGIVGLGAISIFSGKNQNKLMLKALFIALEKVLHDEAKKVYPLLVEKVIELLSEREDELVELNIVGHSHGGMVIDNFIASDEFKLILEEFNVKVKFCVMGCPIVVRKPKHESCDLRQLHNTNDMISLLFSNRLVRPSYVVIKSLPGMHSSRIYAENLKLLRTF